MIIKVERSGGLAAMSVSNEMDTKDLPSALAATAKNIMMAKKSSLPMKSTPMGAADHYTYRISFYDGKNQQIIECNQYNIQDDMKSLVKYIEKYSKKSN